MEDNLASGISSDGSSVEGVGEFVGGIGLSNRPNEGRVVAGQRVITNWSAADEGSGCTAEFGTAGQRFQTQQYNQIPHQQLTSW